MKRKRTGYSAASANVTELEEDADELNKRVSQKCLNSTLANAVPKKMRSVAAHAEPVLKKEILGRSAIKHSLKRSSSNAQSKSKVSKPKGMLALDDEDKRIGIFRKQASLSYNVKLERALNQPMYVLDRTRSTEQCGTLTYPIEKIKLVGTTGNIYTLSINRKSTCNCPDAAKGVICKHLIYVMHRVLKAPSELCHQASLTARELRSILNAAPIVSANTETEKNGNRKPIEGDCPICFGDFESASGDIIYCRAACGNNVHRHCFEQWAAASRITATTGSVRCPFCRAKWQCDAELVRSTANIAKELGRKNASGYVNVAGQLGMSTLRDTSTYHQFWVQRQLAAGATFDDND